MDKLIEEEVQTRKRKKVIAYTLIVGTALIAGLVLLRSSFAPSVSRSAITTAVVEKGDMENTLSTSGEVLPEFEETITSPINASIQDILL